MNTTRKSHHLPWRAALGGIIMGIATVLGAQAEELRTIGGQAFIRTRGAETFKLSLVDVLLFDKKALEHNLEQKDKIGRPLYEYLRPFRKQAEEEYDRADKAVDAAIRSGDGTFDRALDARSKIQEPKMKLDHAANYTMSASYYFSDLPQSLQTTKTDADGKFNFKVSSGSYALAALSSRKVGKETEFYYWMVKITADGDKNVILANDNLCTAVSADSLIVALDGYCGEATQRGINFVTAFVENHKREQAVRQTRQTAEAEKREMERRNDPKAARARAVEQYPDLANPDSPLSEEFTARVTIYRIEKKEFFNAPDWPVQLAKECSEALAAKRKAK